MARQTLRDWVHRFNGSGPEGLIDHKAPGKLPKLNSEQKARLATVVEEGPLQEHILDFRREVVLAAADDGLLCKEKTRQS